MDVASFKQGYRCTVLADCRLAMGSFMPRYAAAGTRADGVIIVALFA